MVHDGIGDPSALAARHPDLVIAPAGTPSAAADALSARLHAPVYVPDGSNPRAIEHDALSVSAVAGDGDAGAALVDQVRRGLARVGREAAALPPVRVFVDRGAFYTIGRNQLGHALLGLAGGIDVASDASVDAPYPLSKLGQAAPQAYLAVRGSGTSTAGAARPPHDPQPSGGAQRQLPRDPGRTARPTPAPGS